MALYFEMTFRARVFYCLQTAGSPFFTIFRSIFLSASLFLNTTRHLHTRGSKGLSRHDLQVDELSTLLTAAPAEISGHLNFLALYDPIVLDQNDSFSESCTDCKTEEDGGFLWHRHQLLESLMTPL